MPKAKTRQKRRPSRPARPSKRQRRRPSRKTALMRIRKPPEQSWALTLDEVALVRNHIAKGSTDEELKFCLAVARRRKLDPFKGQIWFVKRRDSTAEGGHRWIPITGIDGLCHLAARDHKDYGTVGEPTFGPMHAVSFSKNGQGRPETIQAPEYATVSIWKKGIDRPSTSTVYWDEIYPNIDYAPLVRQMPRLMLGKCAVAQALRRTYPATGGLYIPEEVQGPPEFTPEGRAMEILPAQPAKPDPESNWQQREAEGISKLTPAQREVVTKRMQEAEQRKTEQVAPAPTPRTAPAGRALTWLWLESDQEAIIDGDQQTKKELQQILARYVKSPNFVIRVNGDELEDLKYQLHKRGVIFTRRYPKV
jgi:RecT family